MTFINSILLFAVSGILILYLYQITPISKKSNTTNKLNTTTTTNTTTKESFFPIIWNTCQKTDQQFGMPVHRIGPVYNFHQYFNKCIALKTSNNTPTGIPEMGWRNFFLTNFTKNQVKETDSFEGTSVRNFLNNMENVDNIYRKC